MRWYILLAIVITQGVRIRASFLRSIFETNAVCCFRWSFVKQAVAQKRFVQIIIIIINLFHVGFLVAKAN